MIGSAAAAGVAPHWDTVGAAPASPDTAGTDGATNRTAVGSGALLPATPGLTYLTFGQFTFRPNLFVNGYSVSGTGCYCSTSPGFVVANLDLPAGAIVKEVSFAGQNSSGAAASFFVERYALDAGGSENVASVNLPSGAGVIQTGTTAVDHVVDPAYSYDAGVFTTTAIRMFSCRVGFAGPFGFFPVTPQKRKLDTRLPGPLTGKFIPGQIRVLALGPELPGGAVAAVVNVTVTDTTGGGFLSLFPDGTPWPGTASINWSAAGQTIGNSTTVAVSATQRVKIFCDGTPSAGTHVVVDLVGYLR